MPVRNYRIKITTGEKQFEAEGDKAFVLDMLSRFELEDQPLDAPRGDKAGRSEPRGTKPNARLGKSISVVEFVRRVGVKKHTGLVLAFGYYLEKFAGVTDFTSADINKCYYDAKLETSNTSQMLIQCVRSGTIMTAKGAVKGKHKKYTLTQTGEAKVEEWLSAKPG